MDINDYYVTKAPSPQNVLDLFAGEWSSAMPEGTGLFSSPGSAALFSDPRVLWAKDVFGGFDGMNVLELGPLEGAHSYMLSGLGANSVLAVEANSRAFLKCLCIKEIFRLDKVSFILGDFNEYLKSSGRFDLVFASGVLYHMSDPIGFLESICRISDRLFIWTHYYDERIIKNNGKLAHKFGPLQRLEKNGFAYESALQSYKESLGWAGFCGGPELTSRWLARKSILDFLEYSGFRNIRIEFEAPDHQNGPSFAICASRD